MTQVLDRSDPNGSTVFSVHVAPESHQSQQQQQHRRARDVSDEEHLHGSGATAADDWVTLNRHVALGTHAQLRRLCIERVEVAEGPWAWLLSALPDLPALNHLSLRDTRLTDRRLADMLSLVCYSIGRGTPSAVAIRDVDAHRRDTTAAPGFCSLRRLRTLVLADNYLSHHSALAIGKFALWHVTTLEVLDVSGNHLGDHGAQLLGVYLSKMAPLEPLPRHKDPRDAAKAERQLEHELNAITRLVRPDAVADAVAVLLSRQPTLRARPTDSRGGVGGGANGVINGGAQRRRFGLRLLDASDNRMSPRGLADLLHGATRSCVELLTTSHNTPHGPGGIGSSADGFAAASPALHQFVSFPAMSAACRFTRLSLRGCAFVELIGAPQTRRLLVTLLFACQHLEVLDLGANPGLGDVFGRLLYDMGWEACDKRRSPPRALVTLRDVSLWDTGLTDAGLETLLHALLDFSDPAAVLPQLERLDLEGNGSTLSAAALDRARAFFGGQDVPVSCAALSYTSTFSVVSALRGVPSPTPPPSAAPLSEPRARPRPTAVETPLRVDEISAVSARPSSADITASPLTRLLNVTESDSPDAAQRRPSSSSGRHVRNLLEAKLNPPTTRAQTPAVSMEPLMDAEGAQAEDEPRAHSRRAPAPTSGSPGPVWRQPPPEAVASTKDADDAPAPTDDADVPRPAPLHSRSKERLGGDAEVFSPYTTWPPEPSAAASADGPQTVLTSSQPPHSPRRLSAETSPTRFTTSASAWEDGTAAEQADTVSTTTAAAPPREGEEPEEASAGTDRRKKKDRDKKPRKSKRKSPLDAALAEPDPTDRAEATVTVDGAGSTQDPLEAVCERLLAATDSTRLEETRDEEVAPTEAVESVAPPLDTNPTPNPTPATSGGDEAQGPASSSQVHAPPPAGGAALPTDLTVLYKPLFVAPAKNPNDVAGRVKPFTLTYSHTPGHVLCRFWHALHMGTHATELWALRGGVRVHPDRRAAFYAFLKQDIVKASAVDAATFAGDAAALAAAAGDEAAETACLQAFFVKALRLREASLRRALVSDVVCMLQPVAEDGSPEADKLVDRVSIDTDEMMGTVSVALSTNERRVAIAQRLQARANSGVDDEGPHAFPLLEHYAAHCVLSLPEGAPAPTPSTSGTLYTPACTQLEVDWYDRLHAGLCHQQQTGALALNAAHYPQVCNFIHEFHGRDADLLAEVPDEVAAAVMAIPATDPQNATATSTGANHSTPAEEPAEDTVDVSGIANASAGNGVAAADERGHGEEAGLLDAAMDSSDRPHPFDESAPLGEHVGNGSFVSVSTARSETVNDGRPPSVGALDTASLDGRRESSTGPPPAESPAFDGQLYQAGLSPSADGAISREGSLYPQPHDLTPVHGAVGGSEARTSAHTEEGIATAPFGRSGSAPPSPDAPPRRPPAWTRRLQPQPVSGDVTEASTIEHGDHPPAEEAVPEAVPEVRPFVDAEEERLSRVPEEELVPFSELMRRRREQAVASSDHNGSSHSLYSPLSRHHTPEGLSQSARTPQQQQRGVEAAGGTRSPSVASSVARGREGSYPARSAAASDPTSFEGVRERRMRAMQRLCYDAMNIDGVPLDLSRREKMAVCKGRLQGGAQVSVSVEWGELLLIKRYRGFGDKQIVFAHPLASSVAVSVGGDHHGKQLIIAAAVRFTPEEAQVKTSFSGTYGDRQHLIGPAGRDKASSGSTPQRSTAAANLLKDDIVTVSLLLSSKKETRAAAEALTAAIRAGEAVFDKNCRAAAEKLKAQQDSTPSRPMPTLPPA